MSFETALAQWDEGQRRLSEAPADEQLTLERVTQAIQADLRRRLGGAFTVDELVDLYEQGTDWTIDVAVSTAPEDPYAWDVRTVADAAFRRHLRSASDYAGGRRLRRD